MLYVVVPYFNYSGNPMRKSNTLDFLQYLAVAEDIEVIFIEASHNEDWFIKSDSSARSLFPNMTVHLRVPVESIIWRKENLVNIAADHLPSGSKFAWLDSDLTFDKSHWATVIQEELYCCDVVQVFDSATILDENGGVEKICEGIMPIFLRDGFKGREGNILPGHVGFGWATHKDVWKKIGGLPVCNLVGTNDAEFAYGILGEIDRLRIEKSIGHFNYLKDWASKVKVSSGYCSMGIKHCWHGPRETRHTTRRMSIWERDRIMLDANYDPVYDLTIAASGALELTTKGERMQAALYQYFSAYK